MTTGGHACHPSDFISAVRQMLRCRLNQDLSPKQTYYLLSLGCTKNLVDSESMSQILLERGFRSVDQPEQARFLVVNTCGFIHSAKEEAIAAILDLAEYKKAEEQTRFLIVAGCLPQRYARDILSSMPEVDAVIGTADYVRIADVFSSLQAYGRWDQLPGQAGSIEHLMINRKPSTSPAHAYIKIAEGCSNRCAYCAIPGIRGPYRSRPLEDLVNEAEALSRQGYDELILIAQDTTRYGLDLDGRLRLPDLLRAICALPQVRLVRILYVYADTMTDELIDLMRDEPKIARYLDLPIQHASDRMLGLMNRRDTATSLKTLIERLRQTLPGLILRSTVMVGFPGETADDFRQLMKFLKEIRFDRLGCFIFSPEEGTPAYTMRPRVRRQTAENRYHAVMQLQKDLSRQSNLARVGQIVDVTLESTDQDGIFYVGRSYGEAPDVDPVIYVAARAYGLQIGQTIPVRLVDAGDYDLTGVTLDESSE